MKPSHWPDWLDDLWAKSSTNKDKQQRGENLAEHTWLVLSRLVDLAHLRPQLAEFLNAPRLWHCLFWSCFLHDFGKAAEGFQTMLRTKEPWRRRHEVLSLVFLDWIAPALTPEEQQWVLAAIVSHHKDAQQIHKEYDCSAFPEIIPEMVSQLSETTVRGLYRWITGCSTSWISELGLREFGVEPVSLVAEEEAVLMVCQQGSQRVTDQLETYVDCIETWNKTQFAPIVSTLVQLRGLITTADHAASAHLNQIPQGIQCSWEVFAQRVKADLRAKRQLQQPAKNQHKQIDIYEHQKACAHQSSASTWLVAPTGAGKTEAGIYWAVGDGTKPLPRLFYALPYQASMNAMYQRLSSSVYFGEQSVGLQHGRALQVLYTLLLDAELGPASAAEETRWQMNLNRLHAYPVKVFSPYQMLKVLYQIKGFEGMLADYTQAAFIFDEIHAYDPNRLALILALIKHLREHYGARFLVMSATFPQLLRNIITDILGVQHPILAESSLFKAFRRHRLKLLEGDLLEQGIERIVADVGQGKSVLVCCNTVQRAQEMRAKLLRQLTQDQVELLHSRFTMQDRITHEEAILNRCKVGNNGGAFAVVATQVVEVSLNIDLDTIYTDPAPLDALIQRFGRVNRAREKGIVPVHVFREPCDGQGIYLEALVQFTLEELEKHNEEEIDEAAIEGWLNTIYEKPEICTPWKQEYEQQYQLAERLMREVRPFNSDEKREEDFARLFDGVEVLPYQLEKQYLENINNKAFVEASQLFVSISHKKYQYLKSRGKIKILDEKSGKRWIVLQRYDPTLGLILDDFSHIPQDES